MQPTVYTFRFLLISLNIDERSHKSTISTTREKPSKMKIGWGLGDVYSASAEPIKAQDGEKPGLGLMSLMWISHAERPLQADELCYALGVQPHSTGFGVGNIFSTSTLMSCCQGHITADKDSSTVRLIHFAFQGYLCTHPCIFSKPRPAIARICLTYLNSKIDRALPAAPSHNPHNTPFLEYSSVYLGIHEVSLGLELLKLNYSQISLILLLEHAHLDLRDGSRWP